MPKNKNSYWAERARKDKLKVIKTGEKGIDNLKRLLLLNLKDVEKQIKDFYDTYGDNPAEEMSHKEWQQYKSRLKKLAKSNPQDATIQRLAKQNIPKYKIDRLRALELDLQMQLTEATLGQEKGIYKTLEDVSKVSQATLASRMNKTLGLTFNTIASNKMRQILMSDWSGANWSERLWKDRQKVGKKLSQVLQKGIPQGVSLQNMSRELRDLTGESFNNAFRLIRTETSHIDGQVTLEGYKQASNELGLEYYEYDAFLDGRTSSICRELDKKVFKVSEAEVGINYPPMHPNCRSTTQLILDNEISAFGANNSTLSTYDSSQEKIKENKHDPKVLAGVKKGSPMTREQANNSQTNPNYSKDIGYRYNCQTCVIAFEARLRGFDVQAKPCYKGVDSTQLKLSKKQDIAWKHNITGLKPIFKRTEKKENALYDWLNKNVKEEQRYTFTFSYIGKTGNRSGHVISLDKTPKGQIRLYDPQLGKTYIGGNARRYIKDINIINSRILRVDNCTFDKNIVDDILISSN